MIKKIFTLLLSAVCTSAMLWGQDALIRRGDRSNPKISEQTKSTKVETEELATEYFTWQKTYYRKLELSQVANAPLAYPMPRANQKSKNLFTLLFTLASEGKITLYEYIDGEEQLEPEYILSFKDLLTRFGITYQRAEDIPYTELKAYYIKELNYFNQANSTFGKSVLALCPILYQIGEYGETSKPLFWVKYQDLEPFLTEQRSLSPKNEAVRGTYSDFFRLGLYHGEIVKAQDFTGLSLLERSNNPEELKKQQEVLEQQSEQIRQSLSLPDSVVHKAERVQRKISRTKKSKFKSQPKHTLRSVRGLS